MTAPVPSQPESNTGAGSAHRLDPRSELVSGLVWMALGMAIFIGAVLMDRLEKQDINPYTVPGLLPGLLGILMTLLGLLLVLRSWGRLRKQAAPVDAATDSGAARRRVALVVGLCATFAIGLVGHGLPFWAAGALFVSVAILSLQHAQRVAAGQPLTVRTVLTALAIGLGAGTIITLIFQEIFLVHLP